MDPRDSQSAPSAPNPPGLTRRKFVGAGGLLGSAAALGVASASGEPVGPALPAESVRSVGPAVPAENTSPSQEPAGKAGPTVPQAPWITPSGVVPKLAVSAGLKGPRSECGIGALVPWADRLWLITYVAHKAGTGSCTGLYELDGDFTLRKRPESVVGTYANRFVHAPSTQMIIGPHIIDADRNVRTFQDLAGSRLTATMTHLTDPANKVYFLGMEGEFWEADVTTLRVRPLFDLSKELDLPKGSRVHFKGGFSAFRRVVVANNTYGERDSTEGVSTGGRLAEWTGGRWEIVERTAFCDVNAAPDAHGGIFATGWDRASAILKVFAKGKWSTYRLPKGSHCHDHAWYTEWPRIREVETERFLMDAHGLFYELPRMVYGGHVWGVKPICQHLRQIPDFCSWRGMLVMAGDEAAPTGGNLYVGEAQSNLWFGTTDDLWRFGKPQGWGGPWHKTAVQPGVPSDPFLMTGFDRKCLHVSHDLGEAVSFRAEVDFLGDGTWHEYAAFDVGRYHHHEFPPGFSAHWVRLAASKACTATAQFAYT